MPPRGVAIGILQRGRRVRVVVVEFPLPVPLLLGNLVADLPLEAAVATARRLRLPDLRSVASTLRCLHILTHPEALRFPRAETESALLCRRRHEGMDRPLPGGAANTKTPRKESQPIYK